jgi:hypothetical protein
MQRYTRALLVVLAAFPISASSARGQQQVGFLHGMNDGPGVWYSTATSLAGTFGFSASRPVLPSIFTFEDQRASIAGNYNQSAILVGHSNGGIVARYYGQNQHVRGVVTFGSANWGAPLVTNSGVQWFLAATAYDVVGVLQLADWFPDLLPYGTQLDLVYTQSMLANIFDFFLQYTGWIGNPVQNEMIAGSSYVTNVMNGTAAVAAENSNIEVEGSVAFYTDPDGAVFRLLYDNGDAISNVIDGTGWVMLAGATYLYMNGDMADGFVANAASRLDNLGTDLLNIDYVWCSAVSGSYYCLQNDGLVPVWSQALGRGFSSVVDNSPIHTKEPPDAGVPVLTSVLRSSFGFP